MVSVDLFFVVLLEERSTDGGKVFFFFAFLPAFFYRAPDKGWGDMPSEIFLAGAGVFIRHFIFLVLLESCYARLLLRTIFEKKNSLFAVVGF